MTLPAMDRLVDANRTYNRTGMLNSSTKRTLADAWYDVAVDLRRRAEAGEVGYDGFGGGGYAEIRDTEDPERLTPIEAHMERVLERQRENEERARRGLPPLPGDSDPAYTLAETYLTAYVEGARQLKIVEQCQSLVAKLSTPDRSIGRTVAMCTTVGGHEALRDIPCGEQAVARGLCDGCRKRLARVNDMRMGQGLAPIGALSKQEADDLFANRNKRRQYETGPLAEGA